MIFPRLLSAVVFLSCGIIFFIPAAVAADTDDFSPWDAWRQGYTHFERGEQARDRGDYVQSLQSFRESLRHYREVKRARPDWNQTVIDNRIALCEREIAAIRRLLGRPTGTATTAAGSTPATDSDTAGVPPTAPAPETNTRLQTELEQYKQKLFAALVELEDLRKSAAQRSATATELENLMRERRVLQEKYQLLESRYQDLEKKSSEPDAAAEALRRQMIELRINLETTERKLKLATDRNLALEHDLAELQRSRLQLEKELKEAQLLASANREELTSLRQVRDSATGEKNLILAREETLKQSLERAEKQLEECRTELDVLQKRLLAATRPDGAAALNQEVAEENRKLRDDAGKIRTELEKTMRTSSQLQNQLREHKLELEDVKGALQRVDDRRKQAEDENKVLRTQLEKELASRELNSTELKKLRERNQQLEDDLKLWTDKLEKAEQRLNQRSQSDYATVSGLNAERRKMDEEISRLKLETTNLKLQLESSSEKLQKAEAAAAESRSEMLKQKAAVLSAEQESAKAKAVAAERDKAVAELAAAQRNLAAAQVELRDVRKLRKDVEELQKALTAARERAIAGEAAEKRLAEQQKANQQLLDENTRLKKRPGTITAGGTTPQLPAATVSPTQLDELLKNARKAEKENSREVALWNYRTILDSRPDHAEANLGLGRILLQKEQFAEAEVPLRQAHLADPTALPARLAYAQCLLGLKKYGNALALLEPAAKDRKGDGEFQLALGRAYAGARQLREAEQSFRAAMAALPKQFAPQLAMARLLADLPDRQEEAARCYAQAKKLGAAPDAALEKTLGKLLNERGDLIDFLAEAAREAENHGDVDSALWYYGQLRDMAPESGLFAEKLAAYRLLRGQNDEALAALKDRPATAGSAIVRAFIHLRNARYPETTAAAAEALLLNQSEKWPLPKTMKPLLSELDKAPAEAASAVASLRGAIAE